jgi:glucokinase
MRGETAREDSVIIGVDVGASFIAGGLVTPDGEVLMHVQAPTHSTGARDGVERMIGVVSEVHAAALRRGLAIEGVGVGLPCVVDVERGMSIDPQNFVPEFVHVPVADHIRARTGLATWVDNDVNALALGELRWGIAQRTSSLVVLAIGTGVGGALVLNGSLVRGRAGYAGEFGHVSVMMNGPVCFCGGRGCMCMFVAGMAIEQTAQRRLRSRPESKILALAGDEVANVTAALVFEAATSGDGLARSLVDEACEALAASIGVLLNALNPERMVITGGVVRSLAPLREDILQRASKYTLARVLDEDTVHLVPSDKSSSMRGAAALFLYESARRGQAAATAAERR